MKKFLKGVYLIIIICMLLLLAACGENTDSSNNISNDGKEQDEIVQENTVDTVLRENTPDLLPDDLDFNGAEIRIFHRNSTGGFDDWQYEISVGEEIGEIVNDAIYHRNKNVEERLNVQITSISMAGDWSNRDRFMRAVRTSVNSGSDDYDLIAGYAYYLPAFAPEGLLYNLKNVPYLNPEAEWWSADCSEQMTIDGKLYYITGDFAITLLRSMNVIFFNKKLAQDLSIDNLYRIVLDGDFTIDKMSEIIKDTYRDFNGDGNRDRGDMYGYATSTGNLMNAFPSAFDQPIIKKDPDGIPQLASNTPKMIEIVDKMYNFLHQNENVFSTPESSGGDVTNMFLENRTLFMGGVVYNSDILRAMESDYGILPMPKWNKEQPAYYTVSADVYSLFCIPVTCSKIEAVGAVMEALCAESYRKVTPAYYEVALKQKYSRDEETSQMLDIVRAGLKFDFGTVNTANVEGVNAVFRHLMDDKSTDFVSRYESSENTYQTALNKLIEAYQDLP